ncbi:putative HTH-type transcriptional regulator YurK [Psychrobacter pasteurii]|uniref:Putative HTH-type transcriptional regulator YurK n=2 Tax=Psychrobacter pasteurii TaxID=1945520 RepID=A0A1R4EGC2_9GAMM|nr:putative HTH-type transcriptional regulator YurK [Psychrobacter pasteurii]
MLLKFTYCDDCYSPLKKALYKNKSSIMSKNKTIVSKAKRKPKPAYQRIKESILRNIHSGRWQAGDVIPTEHALAEKFAVSRMTVNRALKELSEERVLYRRQGSGTFVAQQQYNHTVVEVRNIAADIKATGKQYKAQVVSQHRVVASEVSPPILALLTQPMLDDSPISQKSFQQREDSDLIDEVKLIHIADGKPLQYEERWVDASLVPGFIEQDFSIVNTSDYLIQQAPLQGGSYTIRAVAAPKKVAQALDLAVGAPALLLSRQTFSAGRVVTFVNMWHAGDSYQISGTL